MPEIKWHSPEDIQSGLVTHFLVPSFGQSGSSKDLSCTAVSQKNCRSFLFFATTLRKDGDGLFGQEDGYEVAAKVCGATLKVRTSQSIDVTQ